MKMDKIKELLESVSNSCKNLEKDCNNILENNNRVLNNNKNIEELASLSSIDHVTEFEEYMNNISKIAKSEINVELNFIKNLMEKYDCDYWVDRNEIGFYNNTEYTIFTEDINEIKKISNTKYIIREQEEYIMIDFKNQKINWIE